MKTTVALLAGLQFANGIANAEGSSSQSAPWGEKFYDGELRGMGRAELMQIWMDAITSTKGRTCLKWKKPPMQVTKSPKQLLLTKAIEKTYPSGSVYKGQFLNGKRHGEGKYVWTNGDQYEGQWEEGKPHGYGVVTYGKGGSYTGELSAGLLNGRGLFEKPDGTKFDGIWEQGLLAKKLEEKPKVNRIPMANSGTDFDEAIEPEVEPSVTPQKPKSSARTRKPTSRKRPGSKKSGSQTKPSESNSGVVSNAETEKDWVVILCEEWKETKPVDFSIEDSLDLDEEVSETQPEAKVSETQPEAKKPASVQPKPVVDVDPTVLPDSAKESQ